MFPLTKELLLYHISKCSCTAYELCLFSNCEELYILNNTVILIWTQFFNVDIFW